MADESYLTLLRFRTMADYHLFHDELSKMFPAGPDPTSKEQREFYLHGAFSFWSEHRHGWRITVRIVEEATQVCKEVADRLFNSDGSRKVAEIPPPQQETK